MFSDRVKQTTSTTGVVNFVLDDTLLTGFASFRSSFSPSAKCYYVVNDVLGNYEIGIGTFTSGSPDNISRDTILSSSNDNLIEEFPAGLKYIYNSPPSNFLSNLVQSSGLTNNFLPLANSYGWLVDSNIYSDGSNLNTGGSISGASITKLGGTSNQFLKADGSVDNSSYFKIDQTTPQTIVSGIPVFQEGLKSNNDIKLKAGKKLIFDE